MGERWDAIVIGGGVAGLSAALLLGRARRRVVVVDDGNPRNRFAEHMHGALGQEGAAPGDLIKRGRDEAAAYGVEFRAAQVQHVGETDHGIVATLGGEGTITARAAVLATGLSDDLPDIPGLAQHWGTRLLHCPYCHGWEVRDQRLGVLVNSPLGLHQAELVRQWSDHVTVFAAEAGALAETTERRLRSRGIQLIHEPVTEVLADEAGPLSVRTRDGAEFAVDALFTHGTPRPHDASVANLGLDRTETPFGTFIAADSTGKTSSDRIWAVGNVVNPAATVPMAIGAGAAAGGAVNAALVAWDFDRAVAEFESPPVTPAEFWEDRYAETDQAWSGSPNYTLVHVANSLPLGRALDLGCGEGADAIWLAQQGWSVTGVDIAPTAIRRATEAARAAGIPAERVSFQAADLSTWAGEQLYDLVTASFLQSPVSFARTDVLRHAANLVAPEGHLLIVSHASPPPWAWEDNGHEHRFLTPDEEIEALQLDAAWSVVVSEVRTRPATAPDGERATLDDTVVLLRRD